MTAPPSERDDRVAWRSGCACVTPTAVAEADTAPDASGLLHGDVW